MIVTLNEDKIREAIGNLVIDELAFGNTTETYLTEVMEKACPYIQMRLKNTLNLPTKDGMKQFYDDQSEMMKNAKGYASFGRDDGHLLEMWEVDYSISSPSSGSQLSIIINNDKKVPGKNQSWDLFRLLWEGTSTYVVPMRLTEAQKMHLTSEEYKKWHSRVYMGTEAVSYSYTKFKTVGERTASNRLKKRMSSAQKASAKVGNVPFPRPRHGGKLPYEQKNIYHDTKLVPWEHPNTQSQRPMTFYNRFKGKFYFNVFKRRGIEGDVVMEFQDYVFGCIYDGLVFGMGFEPKDLKSALRM